MALCLASALLAQQPPAFEVVSLKRASPSPGAMNVGPAIDRLTARFTRMTLNDLVAFACRVRTFQVSAPEWAKHAGLTIEAKLPKGATAGQVPDMLYAVLQERFQLAIHRGTRKASVYALMVDKNGPNLVPHVNGPRSLWGQLATTLPGYAALVSNASDRPVIDMTGLEGEYFFPLTAVRVAASSQRSEQLRASRPSGEPMAEEASEPSGLPLYGIVKKLGLKLTPRKVDLPLIVIDHLEKFPVEEQ